MLWTKFINFLNNNNTLNAIKIIRINEKQKISQQRWYSLGQHAGSRSVERAYVGDNIDLVKKESNMSRTQTTATSSHQVYSQQPFKHIIRGVQLDIVHCIFYTPDLISWHLTGRQDRHHWNQNLLMWPHHTPSFFFVLPRLRQRWQQATSSWE